MRIHIYDHTRMVWLFVPYMYSHGTLTVYKQHIAIANTVLLIVLDQIMNYTTVQLSAVMLYVDSLLKVCHFQINNSHLTCSKSHF